VEAFERAFEARERSGELLGKRGLRAGRREALSECADGRFAALDEREALAFGPRAQALARTLLALEGKRLEEELGVSEEALAGGAVGVLVVAVPEGELAGGERVLAKGAEERVCVCGVGARQRGDDTGGRPGRELGALDGLERRIGERFEKSEAAAHPTDIAAAAAGELVAREPEAGGELAKPRRFAQGGKGGGVSGAGEGCEQCLWELTAPHLHPHGIGAKAAEGGDAAVAVKKHEALGLALLGARARGRSLPLVGDDETGGELSARLERMGEAGELAGGGASASIPQHQAVEVELAALDGEGLGHARGRYQRGVPPGYQVVSLQAPPIES